MNPLMQQGPSDPMAGGGDPMQLMQLLAMLGGTGQGLGAGPGASAMGLPGGSNMGGGVMPQGLTSQGGDGNALLALLAQLMGGGGGGGMMGGDPGMAGLGGGGMGGGGAMPFC